MMGELTRLHGVPLISVVVPTWQRHELLREVLLDIEGQDYPRLEVIVVSDGPDPRVEDILQQQWRRPQAVGRRRYYRHTELGQNWSGRDASSFGVAPILVGLLQAEGEYACWWCDDERAIPEHLSKMVALLGFTNADFAYPRVRFYRNGQDPADGFDIGTDPPRHGQFTHMLFRMSNLWRFGLPSWGSHPVDWALVSAWMEAGATWAFLPEVTFSHRADR